MTENERLNEALEDFETFCEGKALCVTGKALEMVRTAVKEAQAYRAIGTVEEFKALKEKATPMKPKSGWHYNWECGACGKFHSTYRKFCGGCGQVVDWSEE